MIVKFKIREIAKKMPLLPLVYRSFRSRLFREKPKNTEQVFTEIYEHNKWKGKGSVSGTGSDNDQTRIIIEEIPAVIRDFGVSKVLDIPCGDFYWMKNVSLDDIEYIGADIVEDLIKNNSERHGRDGVSFRKLNLIKDRLPKVDLVICRDCLVHLSFEDIFCALENLRNSESEYVLTTTFTGRTENTDIKTGQFRTVNLQAAPFNFPEPLLVIDEGCTEGNGAFTDKSLGLWRIRDVGISLPKG